MGRTSPQGDPIRVLIVGGGVGGLVAAIALRRAGIKAVVFERALDVHRIQIGGGIHLWTNAMRALQTIGLVDAVQSVASVVERAEFCNVRGALLVDWPIGELGRRHGAATIGVLRSDLQRVLASGVEDGVLCLGRQATDFVQDGKGISMRLADGGAERADLLIGADGLRSFVRARLFGEAQPRYGGYAVWQGVLDFEHPTVPRGIFRVIWGPGCRFGFYHVGGERLYWFAVINAPPAEQDSDSRKQTRLLERFRGWPKPVEAILAATADAQISRIDMCDRPPTEKWGEGRVTLLGDAAHAMTFNVGQGACQAIEDGIVLAKCLRDRVDPVAALRTYEKQRFARVSAMQKRAWNIGRAGRWTNPVACAVRERFMRWGSNSVLKKHEEDMLYQF